MNKKEIYMKKIAVMKEFLQSNGNINSLNKTQKKIDNVFEPDDSKSMNMKDKKIN